MENQEQPVLGGQPIVNEQPAAPVAEPTVAEPAAEPQPVATQPAAEKPKKKKSKAWIFILIALLLIGAGVAVFFLFFFNKGGEELSFEKKEPEPEAYTAAYKLKIDYEAGMISADEYVKQLTYTEFDSGKLDKKYKSDKDAVIGNNSIETILDLISENKDSISASTINEFAKHYLLMDVAFGKKEKTSSTNNNGIVLAAESDEKVDNYLHRLDKVVMSSGGNFLIWYTETGDDKITTEQAKRLGENLEKNIKKYSELTGYEYNYSPFFANETNGGVFLTQERLAAESSIPENKMYTAMNVYVMDTKSESTLATYNSHYCEKEQILCDFGYFVQDLFGVNNAPSVAWPYITVNVKSFSGSSESADQVINHELFHHYQQKIICVTDDKNARYASCPESKDNGYYNEALANYFSAKVSGGTNKNNFINTWAYFYTRAMHHNFKLLTDGASYGYGQWPYFYSYENNVKDGLKYLIEAHKKEKPYEYLQSVASKEERRSAINEAAKYAVTKKYDMGAMNNDGVVTTESLSEQNYNFTGSVPAGAVEYYSLGKNWSAVYTDSGDGNTSALLFGKKDNKYHLLKTEANSTTFESSSFSDYTEYILAITNADILSDSTYQLKYTEKDDPNAVSFRNRYDNYAVEYEMSINMMGITTTATGKGRVDEKHQRSYLVTNMKTLMGIEANMITYSDFYNGVDYYTNPKDMFDGTGLGGLIRLFTESEGEESAKWLKTNTASHTIDIDLVARKLRDAKQTQKVGDGHYKVKMTAKEMNDLMNTANSADDKNKSQYEFKNGTIEVDVYISEFGYISKLDYDFSSLVEGIDKFTCTMKLSNFNRTEDVLIPESVRYGAVEEQL